MRWVKFTFRLTLVALVLSILHYNLPQVDVVRIVGTENRRIDFGENAFFWASPDVGTAANPTRDIFFIQTVRRNGRPMVYRNEDTGWGWPPYFKLNSFNVQAVASSHLSTEANPRWVAITHYGWRNEFFTIFPNALRVRPVAGPDTFIFPWAAVGILFGLALSIFLMWRVWSHFYNRYFEPVLEGAGDRLREAQDRRRGLLGAFARWLDSWKTPPRG